MHRIIATLLALLCLLTASFCLATEEVVLYDCLRLSAPLTIDGKADDAAWKAASWAELPYKFLQETPTPAGSRSEFRAGCDDESLYLTAIFYHDSDEALKANHAGRDDPDLWMDDSTEIYFDPASDGHFFKFIVSSAGIVTDFRQTDAGIDYSWTATNAKVATLVTDKAWSLEMSVPWQDFGVKPEPGSMWGFEVLRFSGKNWASWTMGASYNHPEKFGYLCFGGGFLSAFGKLVDSVRKTKGDQWRLVSPVGLLQFSAAGPSLDAAIARASQQITEARFEAAVLSDAKKRADLLVKLTPLQAMLDEAKQAAAVGADGTRIQSLSAKLAEAAALAKDVGFEARIAQALEK
ncbi:MAG: hypothetical protein GW893_20625 [Armatimonadetes bacterium]|nr:hypothetical protein [Armatimonadota bacterium]